MSLNQPDVPEDMKLYLHIVDTSLNPFTTGQFEQDKLLLSDIHGDPMFHANLQEQLSQLPLPVDWTPTVTHENLLLGNACFEGMDQANHYRPGYLFVDLPDHMQKNNMINTGLSCNMVVANPWSVLDKAIVEGMLAKLEAKVAVLDVENQELKTKIIDLQNSLCSVEHNLSNMREEAANMIEEAANMKEKAAITSDNVMLLLTKDKQLLNQVVCSNLLEQVYKHLDQLYKDGFFKHMKTLKKSEQIQNLKEAINNISGDGAYKAGLLKLCDNTPESLTALNILTKMPHKFQTDGNHAAHGLHPRQMYMDTLNPNEKENSITLAEKAGLTVLVNILYPESS